MQIAKHGDCRDQQRDKIGLSSTVSRQQPRRSGDRGHQNRKSGPIKAIHIKAIPGRCLHSERRPKSGGDASGVSTPSAHALPYRFCQPRQRRWFNSIAAHVRSNREQTMSLMQAQRQRDLKYPTSTLLKSSGDMGWSTLFAELRSHSPYEKLGTAGPHVEVAIAVRGSEQGLVATKFDGLCAADGRLQSASGTGTFHPLLLWRAG